MPTLNVSAIFLALASAFLLYGLNYDTRQLESRVQAGDRRADKARHDISVLKAERALLARPERIEPLARSQGLRPATEEQFVRDAVAGGIETGSNPSPAKSQ